MEDWIKFWKKADKNCDNEIILKEYNRIRRNCLEEIRQDLKDVPGINLDKYIDNKLKKWKKN